MFDGDPQAKVSDRDRDRATYVIEAALRNAQISQQDHDLRVERVRSAATVGELEMLTRDVASAPAVLPPVAVVAPAPPTAPPAPAAPTPPTAAPTSAPAAGSVPADLYGPPPTATAPVTVSGSTKKGAPGRKFVIGCLGVVALFFFGPIIFGVILFAAPGSNGPEVVESEPIPAGPPFELNAAGIRAYVKAFQETFGDTEVVRSVFYDGYVVSWVPESDGKVTIWNYLNGAFDQLGDPMDDTADTPPVDLADLRPAKVMALVRTAETTLGVSEPTSTYVIFDRQIIGNQPVVTIYLSNDAGDSGFVMADVDGNVLQTSAPG